MSAWNPAFDRFEGQGVFAAQGTARGGVVSALVLAESRHPSRRTLPIYVCADATNARNSTAWRSPSSKPVSKADTLTDFVYKLHQIDVPKLGVQHL